MEGSRGWIEGWRVHVAGEQGKAAEVDGVPVAQG
jgi:hypothetical protein